ncbi:hypothetical protein JCM3765_007203 [Sporobolomyces pararoseus]
MLAILSLVAMVRAAPVSPSVPSVTVQAAASASTPRLSLHSPKIAPFESVASYLQDQNPILLSERDLLYTSEFDPEDSPQTDFDLEGESSFFEGGGAQVVAHAALDSNYELVPEGLFKRANKTQTQGTARNGTWAAARNGTRLARACIGSSADETTINAALYYGGKGAIVRLCLGAVININNPIFFSAPNQIITTAGNPSGNSRATIVVQGKNQACAVYGAVPGANNVTFRNVQVDGNRQNLGIIYGGIALLEFGGNTVGQRVMNVRAFEPRGWSALHTAEGGKGAHACSGMIVRSNDIGPSGHSPSGALQFRRRGEGYSPGQWADGISHACPNSLVENNVVTDATDGAIVIFGAPGSTISGNTIIAEERVAMGGINAVDWAPFSGTYEGTVVKNNHLIAQNAMIKVGIAIGGMVWGVDNRTASRTYGGQFLDNEFSSGETGYFGYAIGVSGHKGAVITGNFVHENTAFGGVDSAACFKAWFPLPKPQPFIADPTNTPESTFQQDFWLKTVLVLLICKGPGAVLQRISSATA